MDYWQHLDLTIYENWQEFIDRNPDGQLYFMSTKATRTFWDCPYKAGAFLVFGNEGHGLPPDFYGKYRDQMYTIPMTGKFCRSLNLANSVAIAVYEGLRKIQDI
jgi:tRNA (cytidine/uridine-2'-O-)-methyltransferase